jgi:hypothetical protein
MAYARIVSGVLREVFQETVPQGAVTQTVLTNIRISPGQLSRIRGFLKLDTLSGSPTVTATASVVNGRLRVAVANAAAGTTFTWTLDVMLTQSSQQGTDATAGAQIMIVNSAAASASAGDLVFASLADGSLIASGSHPVGSAPIGGGSLNGLVVGRNASIGAGAPNAIAAGNGATVGAGCTGAIAFGLNTVAGTGGSSNCVAIGTGSVLGPGCTSSLAAMGASVSVTGGGSYDIAIGDGVVLPGGCIASVALGRNIAFLVGGISETVAIGVGITIGSNATRSVVIGPSNTVGAYSQSGVVIGDGNTLGLFAAPTRTGLVVLGYGNTIGDESTGNVVAGTSITVYGAGNVVLGAGSVGTAMVPRNYNVCIDGNIATDYAVAIGAASAIIGGGEGSIAIGAGATVTIAGMNPVVGIAIGYGAEAADNQCVIGYNLGAGVPKVIKEFIVRGKANDATPLDTIRAIDTPGANETGLFVPYYDGANYTSKQIKAAVAPPGGSLLLYIDP